MWSNQLGFFFRICCIFFNRLPEHTCSLQRNLWMAFLPTVWILLRSSVIRASGFPSCPVTSSRPTRPSPASSRTRKITKRACMWAWDRHTYMWHTLYTSTDTHINRDRLSISCIIKQHRHIKLSLSGCKKHILNALHVELSCKHFSPNTMYVWSST